MGDAAASSSQPAQAAAAASASSSAASRSLLSALQASLAPLLSSPRLPRGALRLHALFSAPRPALELFPFAHVGGSGSAGVGAPLEARVEHVFCTAAWSDEEEDELAQEAQPSGESQAASLASQATTSDVGSASTTAAGPGGRTSRLIYALECFLYTIPSTHAAILYVSKLDSSGWAPAVVPAAVVPFLPSASEGGSAAGCSLVRAITIGFLRHFASLEHWASAPTPVEHCSIHVLARAQPAYLFPSSPDNPSKHVLSDGKLIAWWRGVLSDVAKEQSNAEGRNFYIVPGYDERMSTELLPLPPREGDSALARARWVYGHPYSRVSSSAPPLPLHRPHRTPAGVEYSTSSASDAAAAAAGAIATLMPHFPDDPKSRFIAEIARDAHELHAPGTQSTSVESQNEPDAKRQRLNVAEPTSAASQQSFDDASQATTTSVGSSQSARLSSSVRKLQRERAALDAVSPDEFWERMGFRQECCAGNAVGVFVCIYDQVAAASVGAACTAEPTVDMGSAGSSTSTTSSAAQRMALAHTTLPDLIRRHMMRDACDWSSRSAAATLTRQWNEGVRRAILRKGGLSAVEAEQADERLGEDVVWTDVRVLGSSKETREQARRKWEEAGKPMPQSTSNEPPKVVNALSVKRKKRPAPAP